MRMADLTRGLPSLRAPTYRLSLWTVRIVHVIVLASVLASVRDPRRPASRPHDADGLLSPGASGQTPAPGPRSHLVPPFGLAFRPLDAPASYLASSSLHTARAGRFLLSVGPLPEDPALALLREFAGRTFVASDRTDTPEPHTLSTPGALATCVRTPLWPPRLS